MQSDFYEKLGLILLTIWVHLSAYLAIYHSIYIYSYTSIYIFPYLSINLSRRPSWSWTTPWSTRSSSSTRPRGAASPTSPARRQITSCRSAQSLTRAGAEGGGERTYILLCDLWVTAIWKWGRYLVEWNQLLFFSILKVTWNWQESCFQMKSTR